VAVKEMIKEKPKHRATILDLQLECIIKRAEKLKKWVFDIGYVA
jgi:hypothetical protein